MQLLHQAFLSLSRTNDISGVKQVLTEARLLAAQAESPSPAAEWIAQQTRLYLRAWDTTTDWDAEIAAHEERLNRAEPKPSYPTTTQQHTPDLAAPTHHLATETQSENIASQTTTTAGQIDSIDLTPLGFWLALAGTATITIAVFVPEISSTNFLNIAHNTLIQNGGGWAFLFLAFTDLGAIYRAYRLRQRTWAPLTSGLIAGAYAIHLGTSNSTLKLCSIANQTACSQGTPGIGIYLAGLGAALLVGAGWLLKTAAPNVFFTDAVHPTKHDNHAHPPTAPSPGRFCTECGARVEPTSNFCPNCGSARPVLAI